jgi:hypothetical protein
VRAETAVILGYEVARQARIGGIGAPREYLAPLVAAASAADLISALEAQFGDRDRVVALSDWAFDDIPVDEARMVDWHTDAFTATLALLLLTADDERRLRRLPFGAGLHHRVDRLRQLLPAAAAFLRESVPEIEAREERVRNALETASAAYVEAERDRIRRAALPLDLEARLSEFVNREFVRSFPFHVLLEANSVRWHDVAVFPTDVGRYVWKLPPKDWFLREAAIVNEDSAIRGLFVEPFARAVGEQLAGPIARTPPRKWSTRSLGSRMTEAFRRVPDATHLLIPDDWDTRRKFIRESLAEMREGKLVWKDGQLGLVAWRGPDVEDHVAYLVKLPTAIQLTQYRVAGAPVRVAVKEIDEAEARRLIEGGTTIEAEGEEPLTALQGRVSIRAEIAFKFTLRKRSIAAIEIGDLS